MKHTLKITLFLVAIFFLAQVIGLLIVKNYIDVEASTQTGNVTWSELPLGFERPELQEETSYFWIIVAILIATGIILLILRFGRINIWKVWFLIGVWLALIIAFFGLFKNQTWAIVLASIFALWKVFKPNIWVHNGTELFIYGGLAAIFVNVLNVFGAFMLLLIISIYDMIAVWKSKHMVKLAKMQTKSKVFAGLLIPYNLPKKPTGKGKIVKIQTAVLGGGDIGFPLIFTGVILKGLILSEPVSAAFLKSLIISVTTALALMWLLLAAKKDRFYPAMPFISAGCVVGYVIVQLL